MFRASRALVSGRPLLQSSTRELYTLTNARALAPIASIAPRQTSKQPRQPSSHPSSIVRTIRLASSSSEKDKDKIEAHKQKVIDEALKPRPDEVSTTSSLTQAYGASTVMAAKPEGDVRGDLKKDIDMVRDTFSLSTVPRESHILGLAGTVPYLATSVSTLFLAWDLTKELPTGNFFYDAIFVNHDTARWLLDLVVPLQIGYGAVIISFLGAIHWGLEYAEKTPDLARTRFRYGMGVASSIIAWPTIFMPLEYALTSQFAAFVALYFADARAATKGWAPPWYGMYRFLLTAMVGLAIFISLAGRAKMSQHGRLSTSGIKSKLNQEDLADRETNWAKLEAEEKERIKKEGERKERERKKKEKQEGQKKKQNAATGKDGGQADEEQGTEKKSKAEKKEDDREESEDEGKDDDKDEGKDDKEKDVEDGGDDKGKKEKE